MDDYSDAVKYQPFRLGGFRLLVVTISALYLFTVAIQRFGYLWGSLAGAAGTFLIMCMLLRGNPWAAGNPFTWLGDYRIRNVFGYRIVFFDGKDGKIRRNIFERQAGLFFKMQEENFLAVPLGGWFDRPFYVKANCGKRTPWRVAAKGVLVFFRNKDFEKQWIGLTDRHGVQVIVTLEEGLFLLRGDYYDWPSVVGKFFEINAQLADKTPQQLSQSVAIPS